MENNYLTHHGIKGQRWGIRRYQNKDGSLTPAGRKRYGDQDSGESIQETRNRLLKSTDASELYKHRNLLTTSEIRERIDRINVETQLGQVAAQTKKSGMDYVDSALKIGRKINEVYEFTNTPVMNSLKKKLGLVKEEPSKTKTFDLEKVYKNLDKLSDKEVKDAADRIGNAERIKKAWENRSKEKEDSGNAKNTDGDRKTDTANKQFDKKDDKSDSNVFTGKVSGNGTSNKKSNESNSKRKEKDTITLDDDMWKDISNDVMSDIYPEVREVVSIGRSYINDLLEKPKR